MPGRRTGASRTRLGFGDGELGGEREGDAGEEHAERVADGLARSAATPDVEAAGDRQSSEMTALAQPNQSPVPAGVGHGPGRGRG